MQTIEEHLDRDDLDQLVPPFPSAPKRLALGVLVLGAAVALTYGILAGWLYPRIDDGGSGVGSSVPVGENASVHLQLAFGNPGHRSLRIDQALLSSGGVGIPGTVTVWSTDDDVSIASDRTLPFILYPGERASIAGEIVPTNCIDGEAQIDADAEIHYAFADGPPSISRTRKLPHAIAASIACGG